MTGITIPKRNPGTSWEWLARLLATLLAPLLVVLSAFIRKELEKFLVDLYKRALETENPWDDWFVGFLLDIMKIERPSS